MAFDNQENVYCADDDQYRTICDNCDKVAIDRYYNNHLKSQTHLSNFNKKQRLINTNKNISSIS